MNDKDPNVNLKARTPVEKQRINSEDLASIHQMIADLEQSAKQHQEITEKMYYTNLPEALFHATTKEKAKRVILEGLKPHKLKFEDDEVVSLSDTVSFAKYCASVTQGTPEDDLVVLEITTQGLDREQARSFLQLPNKIKPYEPLHEVHYCGSISSDFIHQLTPAEIEQLPEKEK